eukprot:3107111-Prymnesium_polylepis.1
MPSTCAARAAIPPDIASRIVKRAQECWTFLRALIHNQLVGNVAELDRCSNEVARKQDRACSGDACEGGARPHCPVASR